MIHYDNDDTEIYVYSTHADFISKTIKYYKNFYEYELLSFLRTNFNNQKT